MDDLLFLAHRIPYPPNKGDKIRSYHMLRYLAEHYRVHLGAFVDNPDDWRHVSAVEEICEDLLLLPIRSLASRFRCALGLLSSEPLTLPYYYNHVMDQWVAKKLKQSCQHVFVFSSAMAQYLEDRITLNVTAVLDFVDVDSDKWRQYSQNTSWPKNWIYQREAKLLEKYEKRIAGRFSRSIFVSKAEAQHFSKLVPQWSNRISYVANGVDVRYFDPAGHYVNPYDSEKIVFVFTGAMDYWANADAAVWFSHEIFPLIKERKEKAEFYVVGARPMRHVRDLGKLPGVHVTGRVEDIRPYLAHANIVVAPLRIARGVQNKVLEAMAMNKQVVATSQAMEGIEICEYYRPLIADQELEFSRICLESLDKSTQEGRRCIEMHYDWGKNLSAVADLLKE